MQKKQTTHIERRLQVESVKKQIDIYKSGQPFLVFNNFSPLL